MKRSIAVLSTASLTLVGAVAVAHGAKPSAPSKVTICHKTQAGTFHRISVSSHAVTNPASSAGKLLRKGLRHTGDVIVVGNAACPSPSTTPSPTSKPPAKILICHKTHSTAHPYHPIVVSSRAVFNPMSHSGKLLRGQLRQAGNLLMPGGTACPGGTTTTGHGAHLKATLHPVAGATGSGTASMTIQLGKRRLCFSLSVSGLADVTAAHIHRASNSAVVVPLQTPTTGSATGCVTVEKALLRELLGNPSAFYVNVHTQSFPNGQIRGTLSS